jgi:hypothetical protein
MSRLLASGLAALVLSAGLAASATAGIFHHRHAEPGCAAEPSCCMPEPIAYAEPSCCAVEPSCCAAPCCPTNPCITYSHRGCHHKQRKGCCVEPTFETVLNVTSPETGCTVCVPVCLPACCEGCPVEKSHCTLFGKGKVRFDWCCGVSVIVRFSKCGDVHVTYVGA